MEVIQEAWSAAMTHERRHRIDLEPVYQRTPVWRLGRQQRLIDSILRNYDIPKIYLTKLRTDRDGFQHEVTDGQQRLRAIWGYLDDQYPLGVDSEDLPDLGDLSGKYFSELSDVAQDRIKLFRLIVAELRDATPEEVRELFLRLQEGEALTPAEKRNAMLGGMRDFIAEVAETHPVFPLTHLSQARFRWHDLAAHVMRLELAEGPTDLKAVDLRRMYQEEQAFSPDHPAASRMLETLNFLAQVLRDRPSEMRIKWGFVDLYLAASRLLHRSPVDLSRHVQSVLLMFQALEHDRAEVEDPADLLTADSDVAANLDLFRYIEAFEKQGATQGNIEIRHSVYMSRLAWEIPELHELSAADS